MTNHSDNKREILLPQLHGLLFQINSKGYFMCTITLTGYYIPWPLLSTGRNEKYLSGSTVSGHSTMELHLTPKKKEREAKT